MRYIAIFLLVANLGYVFWNVTRTDQTLPERSPGQSSEQATENRALLNTGITLISEFTAQSAEQERLNARDNALCTLVSGFASLDEASAFLLDAQQIDLAGDVLLLGEPMPSQYRVYLPPASSREIATIILEAASEAISAADLEVETYLITRGALVNGIALGVFSTQENADEVQTAVTQLGYTPQVEEIARSDGGYGVWLRNADSSPLNEAEWLDLSTERSDLIRSENLCQTLVQASQFP